MLTALLIWLCVLILAIGNVCFIISLERRVRRLERLDRTHRVSSTNYKENIPPNDSVDPPKPLTFRG